MFKKYSYQWLATLINLFFFVVFLSVFYPIYDSKEDAYAAYLLSGGFGNPPTDYLHYNYGFHPLLNLLVKNLFLVTDRINWYSIILIAGHYLSSTIILTLLIRKSKKLIDLLGYTAVFLIFEGFFLVIIDFSGASVVLTCTALLYLLVKCGTKLTVRHCIIAGLLLLLASFYRIHTMLLVAALTIPFFLLLTTAREKIKIISTLLGVAITILLFSFLHRYYYTSKDPGWPVEEANRQKIFSLYNFHTPTLFQTKPGEKWHIESQLISRGLLIDSSFLKGNWLDPMYRDMVQADVAERNLPDGWTKWFLINNRIFFCITILMIVLYARTKRLRITLGIALVLLAAGVYYLAFKAKLPPYILSSFLFFVCLVCLLKGEINPIVSAHKAGRIAAIILLLFFITWGIIRAHKTSLRNKWQNSYFKNVYKEISADKSKLFIITKNFPIHKFYAFDLPRNYKLENYTDTEHFIINLYQPVFRKFGINTNSDIPYLSNIYFWGEPIDALRLYFEKLTGQSMKIITLPGYKYGVVWRIVGNK
jgi:hypothetical protein